MNRGKRFVDYQKIYIFYMLKPFIICDIFKTYWGNEYKKCKYEKTIHFHNLLSTHAKYGL